MSKTKSTSTDKKPFYKQVWFWVVVVVVLIAIGGAGISNKPEVVGNYDGNSSEQTSDGNSEFKVGDIISFEGQEVVVTSVERNYSTGNKYTKPSEGKEFVKVNIQIQNKSQDKESFNALDWEIEDSDGVINDYSILGQADDHLGYGDLAAGGTKKGSLVFEVPAGDKGLKLHFTPNIWSSKEVVINL